MDPNGNNRGYPGVKSEDDSDDDELVEISNSPSRRTSLSYAPATPLIMLGTPSPADSREYSSAIPVSSRNGNLKRPHEVVDLTLDSSDDDSPTPKRVSGPTSIPHLTNNHVHHSMSNFANSHHLAPSSVNFPFTQGRPPPPARSYNLPSNDYR